MEGEDAALGIIAHQPVTGRVAEMLEIQRRRRIIGKHFENAALHLADLPACLQNGQRAFQTSQVKRDGDGVTFIHNDATLDRVQAPFQWQLIAATLASTCCQPLDRRMSIWGMIIGGAAGAAIGGPIGGLLGAAAGIAVERGFVTPVLAANTEKDASRGVAFTVAVIALSAKMAKADGMVTRDEISAFRERVHIPPSEVPQVGRFWDLARQTKEGYEGYATQVARMFSPRAPVLEQLLDLLFHIAGSDGSLTAPEIEYLARVSEIFGFTEEDFHRWLALHGDEGPRPWDVLGVDPAIPDDELRTRWKALVRDHHPDKLVADGMPEEFVAAANDRLARINAAYDSMMRSRGFGGAPAGGAG